MITFNCTIQEGVIPDGLRATLDARLIQIGAEVLGVAADDISVHYEIVPQGFAYRGGRPSTSSNIRGVIPPGHSQATRVAFMQRVQDMWLEVTGQTTDEVVVGAADFGYNPHNPA